MNEADNKNINIRPSDLHYWNYVRKEWYHRTNMNHGKHSGMYKGIEILDSTWKPKNWVVTLQVFDHQEEKRLRTYRIRYNAQEGYVIAESEDGVTFKDVRNPARMQDILYILPRKFIWEWEELKSAIVHFSKGQDKGRDGELI